MATEITVTEAAATLGLSTARVRQFIEAGRLRARRVSARLYLIQPGDLAAVEDRPGPGYPAGRPRKRCRSKTK